MNDNYTFTFLGVNISFPRVFLGSLITGIPTVFIMFFNLPEHWDASCFWLTLLAVYNFLYTNVGALCLWRRHRYNPNDEFVFFIFSTIIGFLLNLVCLVATQVHQPPINLWFGAAFAGVIALFSMLFWMWRVIKMHEEVREDRRYLLQTAKKLAGEFDLTLSQVFALQQANDGIFPREKLREWRQRAQSLENYHARMNQEIFNKFGLPHADGPFDNIDSFGT